MPEKSLRHGTIESQMQLAVRLADKTAARAREKPLPELRELYSYMFACFHFAIEIVILSRTTEKTSGNEFITWWSYLGEYLKRALELKNKYPDLLNEWPRSPGIVFSYTAGWSALDVAFKYARMIFDATLYTSAVVLGCRQPYLHMMSDEGQCFTHRNEGCGQQQLHKTTISGRKAQKWIDLTIQDLRTESLVTVSEWPMKQVLRDTASLTYKLEAEFLRATGEPAEPGPKGRPGGKPVAPAELNDTEENIIEALNTNTLTGEKLCNKAGYPYNSNFKSTLSSLRKRGILGNKSPGYFLEPRYHFLLEKSDQGQD